MENSSESDSNSGSASDIDNNSESDFESGAEASEQKNFLDEICNDLGINLKLYIKEALKLLGLQDYSSCSLVNDKNFGSFIAKLIKKVREGFILSGKI